MARPCKSAARITRCAEARGAIGRAGRACLHLSTAASCQRHSAASRKMGCSTLQTGTRPSRSSPGSTPQLGSHAPSPLDAVSAWPWISGRTSSSARRELIYDQIRTLPTTAHSPATCLNVSGVCVKGAIQRDGWKLVVGPEPQNTWNGWFSPNASVPFNTSAFDATKCPADTPCLFNLDQDLTEHTDVSAAHADVVASLLARFVHVASVAYHPPLQNPAADLSGYCAAVRRNGNFVGPWMSAPNEQTGGHAGADVSSWSDLSLSTLWSHGAMQ